MRIAVIGGLDRHVQGLAKRAAEAGHEAEFHQGWVGGRHAEDLEAIVRRCDVVVIVTAVNSHGAVSIAKKAARRRGLHRPNVRPVPLRADPQRAFPRQIARGGHAGRCGLNCPGAPAHERPEPFSFCALCPLCVSAANLVLEREPSGQVPRGYGRT